MSEYDDLAEWPDDDPSWDDPELMAEIDQAKATDMGRAIRIAVVQNVYDQGLLTEAQAREILSGPLTPGGDNVFDDSDELRVKK